MKTVSKETFLRILKFRPLSLIGKEIIYDKKSQRIADISLSGDYILLDKEDVEWFPANSVDDYVVINGLGLEDWELGSIIYTSGKIFTVKTFTENIETLKKLVGQPADEKSLSLFEIVEALHKRVAELRQYIEKMEAKDATK